MPAKHYTQIKKTPIDAKVLANRPRLSAAITQSNRAMAAIAIDQVLSHGKALDDAIDTALQAADAKFDAIAARDRAHINALCFATLRHAICFAAVLKQRISKKPDALLQALLLVALADLHVLQSPPHAAVGEAVNAAKALGFDHASGLVNAVLRRLANELDSAINSAKQQSETARAGLPDWLVAKLKQHYPARWLEIAEQSQQQAPMWIRVNRLQHTRDDYAGRLPQTHLIDPQLPDAICLAASAPVSALPDFSAGACSVQDGAAQMAAWLLAPKAGERILDACAAPGGKTAHLLEIAPNAEVIAAEIDPKRAARITENLARLALNAQVHVGDAAAVPGIFDAILLDAPCSATGVIRRHPDIAFLRRATDIASLQTTQQQLLQALWRKLKPGGRLLYATCSILPEENSLQMQAFVAATPDAKPLPIPDWFGIEQTIGRQNLPGMQQLDGFYYALLQKAHAHRVASGVAERRPDEN
jgi:16S rRNA (cytosine967-C5)-methyltransferase